MIYFLGRKVEDLRQVDQIQRQARTLFWAELGALILLTGTWLYLLGQLAYIQQNIIIK